MRSEHKGLAMTQAFGPLQATSRSENLQLMKKNTTMSSTPPSPGEDISRD